MNRITRVSILLLLFVFCIGITTADAQRRKKRKKKKPEQDEYFEEGNNFAYRLWYGGGFNLGFSGNNVYNIFNIGISPMVGYKVTDAFSFGPRVGINYSFIKGTGADGRTKSVEPLDYSVGLFSRYKILPAVFAHVEYGFESVQQVFEAGNGFLAVDQSGDVITIRDDRSNFFIGAGYSSGGIVSGEISILYNVLSDSEDINDFPWDFRFGITYNF